MDTLAKAAIIKKSHKFVIMDFELSMIDRTSMVLISGAMSNSLDRFKIRKLEGRPLLLPVNGEVRPTKDREILLAIKEIKRVFRCKEALGEACLSQIDLSLKSKLNNLDKDYIENYLRHGDQTNVIVLWNGESDKRVLNKLKIDTYHILNIKCYDKLFNQQFSIQFEKMDTKQIIFEIDIGTFNKTGRLLNLEETHSIICKKNHKVTHAHDPKTNVRLTKCIFDFVIRKQGYDTLIINF